VEGNAIVWRHALHHYHSILNLKGKEGSGIDYLEKISIHRDLTREKSSQSGKAGSVRETSVSLKKVDTDLEK